MTKDYDRYFTRTLDDPSIRHEVEHNLDLLKLLEIEPSDDRLELWINETERNFARELRANLPENRPLIALGVGAGAAKRTWPIERFIAIAEKLREESSAIMVALGGPGDEWLGHELQRALGGDVVDLTGRTSIGQTCAVLEECSLFIGNDSGPMHLAAAAGIPVVEISCHAIGFLSVHANAPERFRPWGVPYQILRPQQPAQGCFRACRQRHPHCILDVSIQDVYEAASDLQRVSPLDQRKDRAG